jgi:multidrug transporter EmrE-like cation transporter
MYLLLFLAGALSSIGNVSMKLSSASAGAKSSMLFLIGCLFYGANLACFRLSITRIDLAIAYPVLAALSICMTTLLATTLLKEDITISSVLGITLCIAGISLLSGGRG